MATRAGQPVRAAGWRGYLIVGAATVLLTATLMALSFGFSPANGRQQPISLPLLIHLATVIPALPLGAYLLLRRKGDRLHRRLGRLWAGMMVTTAIASFWIQESGRLSFIHLFSVVTLLSVAASIFWIRRGHVDRHRRSITNLYIGLVVAGLFTFVPGRLLGTWLFG